MKNYILIIALLLSSKFLTAQVDTTKRLTAMQRSYNNKIVLRLFPANQSALLVGNKKGYKIQRADAEQGDITKLNYKDIKNTISQRLTEDSGVSYIDKNNITDTIERKMAGLAYGLTETNALPKKGDVLVDGVASLKEQQQDESMKFFMINIACNKSKLAAKIMGLWVDDEDVVLGKTYAYRVKINDEKNDWYYIKVKCQNFNPNYLLNNNLIKLNEGDTKINFTFPEGYDYYAFNIDRANYTKDLFKRLNNEPMLKINPTGNTGKIDYTFGDSNLVNYKKYFYKVWVNTPFGDEILLADFSAMPRDKTPPPMPAIKTANHIKPTQVEIKWDMDDKNSGDLKGFIVKRSNKNEGPFKQISQKMLETSARVFIDETFDKEGENYYILEAIDTAGNMIESYPAYVTLIDSTPPAIPIITKATIDSLGKITIKIKPNIEKDFMGYQLLKANEAEHEFSVVQETYKDSLGATTFVLFDSTTLQSLTPNIFYKLISFDTHYNQSEPSEIIKLKRPDTIPPVSPIIKGFKLTDSTIVLNFSNSSSDDVIANYLLRREVGKEKFDTIFLNKDFKIETFVDKKIVGGKQYEYTMIAKDDAFFLSKKSRSLIIRTLFNNELPVPILQGTYNEKQKFVTLNYKFNSLSKSKKSKIEVYTRKSKSADWVILKSVDVDVNKSIIDDKLPTSEIIFYIAKITDENSNSSIFSKPIEVKIK